MNMIVNRIIVPSRRFQEQNLKISQVYNLSLWIWQYRIECRQCICRFTGRQTKLWQKSLMCTYLCCSQKQTN